MGAPSHIIIHTGTNDLSTRRVDITKALSNVVRTASRIYPRAKVIISSLLPCRRATKDHQRHQRGDSEHLCSNTECSHSQPSASHTSASLRSYPHPPRWHETVCKKHQVIDPEQPSENTSGPGGERQLRRCSGTTR